MPKEAEVDHWWEEKSGQSFGVRVYGIGKVTVRGAWEFQKDLCRGYTSYDSKLAGSLHSSAHAAVTGYHRLAKCLKQQT